MNDIPWWRICLWGTLVVSGLWNISSTVDRIYDTLKNR